MNEILRFLQAFADVECRANHAKLVEPDDEAFHQRVTEWDAMCSSDLRSGLDRPAGEPVVRYASADHLAAAARQRPRSVLAIARYRAHQTDLYRGWMGDTEHRPRGEAMRASVYVVRQADRLRVVARYEVCDDCLGAKAQRSGERCRTCDGAGWFHRGGTPWLGLVRLLELRKLGPPTDQRYRRGYDAID
jgi:hypothetical protein